MHNQHKYRISAMCKVLSVPRSTYYYRGKLRDETWLADKITQIFKDNKSAYGTRRIKASLAADGVIVSERKIGRIMKSLSLKSTHTKKFKSNNKVHSSDSIPSNQLKRDFNGTKQHEVLVSDVTYIRLNKKWHYLCLIVDLFGRVIVGFSIGTRRDAKLVESALCSISIDLRKTRLFHSDQGSEYNNKIVCSFLSSMGIEHSMSAKGTPHDNAVLESMNNIIKTEFVKCNVFHDIYDFRVRFSEFVHWYNTKRLNSSLGNMSPLNWCQKYGKYDCSKKNISTCPPFFVKVGKPLLTKKGGQTKWYYRIKE